MQLDFIRRSFEPVLQRFLHFYWRFARGLTIGVRALVIDGAGRVFLIKHSYIAGWHLPGGGGEVGETLMKALARELHEEGNIELTGPAPLFGIYYNRRVSRRDHVALYVVRSFLQVPRRSRTAKSWRTAFSRPMPFRRIQRALRVRASPKSSSKLPLPSFGELRNAK